MILIYSRKKNTPGVWNLMSRYFSNHECESQQMFTLACHSRFDQTMYKSCWCFELLILPCSSRSVVESLFPSIHPKMLLSHYLYRNTITTQPVETSWVESPTAKRHSDWFFQVRRRLQSCLYSSLTEPLSKHIYFLYIVYNMNMFVVRKIVAV